MHLRWFRPMKKLRVGQINHRTHRKLLVVDEDTAFTGGVGIADEWQGDARNEHEWRDTHFRVRGPAVDGLRAAFLDNWIETDPDIFEDGVDRFPDQQQRGSSVVQCVRGASETGWSDAATMFRSLLQLAERSRPAHDRLLRSRRGPHRPHLRRRRPRRHGRDPPARPPRGQADRPGRVRSLATSASSTAACTCGASSRACCTPRS